MIWIIVATYLVLAIIDTAIGNRILPSRVCVEKREGKYVVAKWHRYAIIIRVKLWLEFNDSDRVCLNFTNNVSGGFHFGNKDKAVAIAQIYANQAVAETHRSEVVWTSRRKKGGIISEEELTMQLGQALIEGRKEDEEKIMLRLKELKYI